MKHPQLVLQSGPGRGVLRMALLTHGERAERVMDVI